MTTSSLPFCVGLTGGIGCGKSTVAEAFAQHGIDIIDADVMAREVVKPGTPGLAALIDRFGEGILDSAGALDRQALRTQIFAEPKAREDVESLLHPLIWAAMRNAHAEAKSPYCIMAIPLLIESGNLKRVDRILVVDCPRELQIQRAMQRDHASRQQIEAILAAQVSREQRLAAADDVLDNSGSPQDLQTKIGQLHQQYLQNAALHP